MKNGTNLSRALRAVVVCAVLVVLVAFVVQSSLGVIEKAESETDDLAARDVTWFVTACFLLTAGWPSRAWRHSSSRQREALMTCLRLTLAIAGIGVTLDIAADLFISYLILRAGIGRTFAWAGFLALVVSIVVTPAVLLLARPRSASP